MKKLLYLILFVILTRSLAFAQNDSAIHSAFLFAHMTSDDYGGLYYSVSTDGLTWKILNNGMTVFPEYRGHPDICKGRDGNYYIMGVTEEKNELIIWQSSDLINWSMKSKIPEKIMQNTPGHRSNPSWYGAPKMFYDDHEDSYIITWHAPKNNVSRDDFIAYWSSMRTFYILTKNFRKFTDPRKLFDFDLATIDVIIRKEGDLYYAFIKDEREATFDWPTGKAIRVCVSRSLTGPYAYPGDKISPSYREAPTVIPKPDNSGYYMYYEQYPGVQYEASEAPTLAGPWFDIYSQRIEIPEQARHGCMIPIGEVEYERIIQNFKLINKLY